MNTSRTGTLSFGIKTSQAGVTFDDILRTWREADEVQLFEHAWLWDHMVPLRGDVRGAALEAWTLLAALSAQTKRLRIGVMVTSNRLRPPALLAKMAATVDQISGGRLIFGIGAGGSRVPDPAGFELVRREFEAYGIDIVSPGDAVAALGEACTIIRRMWTETEPFDFEGRFYHLKGAVCEPKPIQQPHPPVLIGAAGPKALRIVAEKANIWNCPARTTDEFRSRNTALNEACAEVGRNPQEIVRQMQLLVRATGVMEVRNQVRELIEAGCTQIVLAPVPPYPPQPVRWLAEEVLQPVLRELAAVR